MNYLELLFYRAPKPLDWSSPRSLLLSTLQNRLHWVAGKPYQHPISHVNVVLNTSSGGKVSRGMALSTSSFGYLYRFLFKGTSLDTLIINLPGKFLKNDVIEKPLQIYLANGYVEVLRINLTVSQSLRAEQYIQLYEQYGLNQIYGALASDPLKGHGAGCSAFAMSVLDVLGLLPEEFKKSWRRELRIPSELMSSENKKASIGFFGLLLGRRAEWSHPEEPHYRLIFWDPENMYNWCKRFRSSQIDEKEDHKNVIGMTYNKNSSRIEWDATGFQTPDWDLKFHFQVLDPLIQKEISDCGKTWTEQKLQTLLTNQS